MQVLPVWTLVLTVTLNVTVLQVCDDSAGNASLGEKCFVMTERAKENIWSVSCHRPWGITPPPWLQPGPSSPALRRATPLTAEHRPLVRLSRGPQAGDLLGDLSSPLVSPWVSLSLGSHFPPVQAEPWPVAPLVGAPPRTPQACGFSPWSGCVWEAVDQRPALLRPSSL